MTSALLLVTEGSSCGRRSAACSVPRRLGLLGNLQYGAGQL
jgi:hypothetical protein